MAVRIEMVRAEQPQQRIPVLIPEPGNLCGLDTHTSHPSFVPSSHGQGEGPSKSYQCVAREAN